MPPRRDDEPRHELRLGTPAAARVRLTVGIPIGLLALCLVAAFVLIPSGRTELTFFAAVIAGAAGVYSAYYGAANLRSQVELGKKRHALEFIQHWPTEQRARERRLLRERLKPDAMPKTSSSSESSGSMTISRARHARTSTSFRPSRSQSGGRWSMRSPSSSTSI